MLFWGDRRPSPTYCNASPKGSRWMGPIQWCQLYSHDKHIAVELVYSGHCFRATTSFIMVINTGPRCSDGHWPGDYYRQIPLAVHVFVSGLQVSLGARLLIYLHLTSIYGNISMQINKRCPLERLPMQNAGCWLLEWTCFHRWCHHEVLKWLIQEGSGNETNL